MKLIVKFIDTRMAANSYAAFQDPPWYQLRDGFLVVKDGEDDLEYIYPADKITYAWIER